MKKSKSLSALFLALVMCITLLPVSAVMAEDASLISISVGSDTQAVTAGTQAYTFNNVPVMYPNGTDQNAAVLPAITAVAANSDNTVTVATPVINGTVATATITVSNGDEYSVTLKLIGTNVYTNGGFETAENTNVRYAATYDQPSRRDDAACSGTYNIAVRPSDSKVYMYHPSPVIENGKTYISSITAKLFNIPEVTPEKIAASNFCLMTERVNINTGSTNHKVYRDGVLVASNWGGALGGLKQNTLHRLDSVDSIVLSDASTTGNLSVWLADNGKQNLPVYEDDFFFGELVIADAKLTANGVEIPSTIETDSAQEKVYAVAAEVVNQLGTASGMENTTVTFTLDAGETGATLTGGTLTIPTNAEGNIKLTVTVTPNWTGALQTSYVKTQEIELFKQKALSELIVGGTPIDVETFDPTTDRIKVPAIYENGVEVIKLPVIYAKAKAEGNTVAVSTPVVNGNTATATVTVMNGATEIERYALTMDIIGKNVYENGGFESAENTNVRYAATYDQPSRRNDAACSGTYNIAVRPSDSKVYMYHPSPVIENGKTYLSSISAKLFNIDDVTPEKIAASNFCLMTERENINTSSTNHKVYRDGVLVDTSWLGKLGGLEKGTLHRLDSVDTIVLSDAAATGKLSVWLADNGKQNLPVYEDDFFFGELVIGGAKLTATGNAIPEMIYTGAGNKEITGITPVALNQIGTASGMENTTTSVEMVANPTGVSYENGVLTIPQNAAGTITFKATVTPTAAWADAQQTAYVEYITVELFNSNEITKVQDGSAVSFAIRYCNATNAEQDIIAYYAVYMNGKTLKSVESVPAKVGIGAIYEAEKSITVAQGETVECFLWEKGTLKALIAK